MRSAIRSVLFLGAAVVFAGAAEAVIIDFDALANETVVTNQFPEATFSSDQFFECKTIAHDLGSSLPNYLCTAHVAAGTFSCVNSVIVDFTMPVNNLTFLAIGDDSGGVQAKVDVHENTVFSATVDIVTDGNNSVPDLVDLSGFTNVTKIVIHTVTDPDGLGWDDFAFDISTVPVEPSTWGSIKALCK